MTVQTREFSGWRELTTKEAALVSGGVAKDTEGDPIIVTADGLVADVEVGGFCVGWSYSFMIGQFCVAFDGSDAGIRVGITPQSGSGPELDVVDESDMSGVDVGSTSVTVGVTASDVKEGLENFLESYLREFFPDHASIIYDGQAQ